jgi:hypothetical protein
MFAPTLTPTLFPGFSGKKEPLPTRRERLPYRTPIPNYRFSISSARGTTARLLVDQQDFKFRAPGCELKNSSHPVVRSDVPNDAIKDHARIVVYQ